MEREGMCVHGEDTDEESGVMGDCKSRLILLESYVTMETSSIESGKYERIV